MSYYAGIDPSITNTGIVVLDDDCRIVDILNSKTIKVLRTKNPTPCKSVSDYLYKTNAIAEFLWKYRDGLHITYEDYSYDSTHRAFSMAEYGGILKSQLLPLLTDELKLVAPTTVKKFATGNGFASKERMVEQAMKENEVIATMPKANRTDDICDAYFLAKLCWYKYNKKKAPAVETSKELLRLRMESVK